MKRTLISAFAMAFVILALCLYFVSSVLKDRKRYYQHSTIEMRGPARTERIHMISRLDDYHNCMVGLYAKRYFPDSAVVASDCYDGEQFVSKDVTITYEQIYKGRFESKGSSSPYIILRDKSGLDAIIYTDIQNSIQLKQLTSEIKQRPSVLEATFVSN